MPSANFLIGNGLSLQDFEKYLEPFLKQNGYIVVDKCSLRRGEKNLAVLVSIIGQEGLEKGVEEALAFVANFFNDDDKTFCDCSKLCKIIDKEYGVLNQATKLFPKIKLFYNNLLNTEDIELSTSRIENYIRSRV